MINNKAPQQEILKPFFGRIGSKIKSVAAINKLIPHHKIYIEPFVGGGSVFWNLPTTKNKIIINDLEKDLIDGYKLLKKGVNIDKIIIPDELADKNELYTQPARTPEQKLTKYILKFCNTYCSSGKGAIYNQETHSEKIKNIPLYTEKLKGVTILNQDYKKVIKKYDSPSSFFFLDPPYENSAKLYENDTIDYEEMNKLLLSINGLFILTLNDSPNVRKIFNRFIILPVNIPGRAGGGMGKEVRKELLIMNYQI